MKQSINQGRGDNGVIRAACFTVPGEIRHSVIVSVGGARSPSLDLPFMLERQRAQTTERRAEAAEEEEERRRRNGKRRQADRVGSPRWQLTSLLLPLSHNDDII